MTRRSYQKGAKHKTGCGDGEKRTIGKTGQEAGMLNPGRLQPQDVERVKGKKLA